MTAWTPEDLDHDHIREAAEWAVARLRDHGYARVRLSPGDATEYRISIAAPAAEFGWGGIRDGRYHWVDLCTSWGGGYEWNGGPVSAGYAAEKWTRYGTAGREHTGMVMAAFLTAVAETREAA